MAKHRKNLIRTIRYVLLAVWLSGYLLTIRFYQPQVVTVRTWNQTTQRMVVLNQVQGLNKQAITALFLVIGALIIVGSLYPIGGPRSAADSVVMKRRRKNGRSWFNLRPLMCSRCGSTRIHRSRRWNIEWVLMFVLVRPYRCHSCTTRFYAFVPFVMLKRRVA